MADEVGRAWVRDLLERNRYLVLSTTDGTQPWAAPLEYMVDPELNLYFFSPEDVRHVKHLGVNDTVAVAVFDSQQPEYSGGTSMTLNGIQIEATASRLAEDDYSEAIVGAIESLELPMPPYAVFKIQPQRFYVPKIEDGVNVRAEVDVS